MAIATQVLVVIAEVAGDDVAHAAPVRHVHKLPRESAAESCGASNLTAALLLSYTKHCERVGQTDNESVHEKG